MKLSPEIINEFQKIYQEEFGEKISPDEACEKFLRLVNLLRVILRPKSKRGADYEENSNPFPSMLDQLSENDKLKKYL